MPLTPSRPLIVSLGLLLLGWLWIFPAGAEAPGGSRYDAEVPIEDQSPEQRNRAIEGAFRVVLGRLFGGDAATSDPRLAEVTKSAPRLVRSYRFRSDEGGGGGPRQMLAVQFDEAAVNRALREKGLTPGTSTPPPAGAPRPASPTATAPAQGTRPAAGAPGPDAGEAEQGTLLLWLGSERSGQQDFATPETEPRLVAAASAAAREAGLPVLFPLYDLGDRAELSTADLWAMRTARIQEASRRYATERVLVGLVSGSDTAGWTGRWVIMGPEGVTSDWTTRGASPSAVVQAGVQQASGRGTGAAAAKRAPAAVPPATPAPPPTAAPKPAAPATPAPPSPRGTEAAAPAGDLVAVRVSGMQRSDDYLRVQKYLAGIPGVGQVQILGVGGDAVTFGVGRSAEALARALAGGKVLAPEEGAPPGAAQGRQMRYRLLP